MLEVARRLGNGEVSADAPIAAGEDVSFVSEKREPSSISDNLVQLKDGPIVADTAQQRKETMAALTGAPEGPLAEVAAKAAELNEKHAQEEAAADARAAYEERVRARHEAEAAAAEAARIAEAQAASAAAAAAASRPASVPDWYKKATEKAREKMAESNEQAAADDSSRSRFADYPTGAAQASAAASPQRFRMKLPPRSLRLLSRLFLNRLLPPLRPHVLRNLRPRPLRMNLRKSKPPSLPLIYTP